MVRCSAPMCFNSLYKKPPNITFHRFPKDEQLRNAWLKNMNKKDWQPKPSSVVCSKHFEVNLFEQSVFRTILAPGAIPTIFKNAEFQERSIYKASKITSTPIRRRTSHKTPKTTKELSITPETPVRRNVQVTNDPHTYLYDISTVNSKQPYRVIYQRKGLVRRVSKTLKSQSFRMFLLKQMSRHARRVMPDFRAVSSSGPLVGLDVDNEGIATVTMQRPPVNSLNLRL